VTGLPFRLRKDESGKIVEYEPAPSLQVVVPMGISIGQHINVEPPEGDGEMFAVVVPPDFHLPGSAFSILRDAVRLAAVPGAVIVPGIPFGQRHVTHVEIGHPFDRTDSNVGWHDST
jgi:hypothetical protein